MSTQIASPENLEALQVAAKVIKLGALESRLPHLISLARANLLQDSSLHDHLNGLITDKHSPVFDVAISDTQFRLTSDQPACELTVKSARSTIGIVELTYLAFNFGRPGEKVDLVVLELYRGQLRVRHCQPFSKSVRQISRFGRSVRPILRLADHYEFELSPLLRLARAYLGARSVGAKNALREDWRRVLRRRDSETTTLSEDLLVTT